MIIDLILYLSLAALFNAGLTIINYHFDKRKENNLNG